jgi:hypothetical protein
MKSTELTLQMVSFTSKRLSRPRIDLCGPPMTQGPHSNGDTAGSQAPCISFSLSFLHRSEFAPGSCCLQTYERISRKCNERKTRGSGRPNSTLIITPLDAAFRFTGSVLLLSVSGFVNLGVNGRPHSVVSLVRKCDGNISARNRACRFERIRVSSLRRGTRDEHESEKLPRPCQDSVVDHVRSHVFCSSTGIMN